MENALVTGGNGFLGTYLVRELKSNYNVFTLARKSSDFNIDLSVEVPKLDKKISLVVHAAGKAHTIPKSKKEIQEFYNVNTEGTKKLLEGLISNVDQLKTFVLISSVAVYGKEYGTSISETHPLNGSTPYAKSKIKAEREVVDFCNHYNINYIILRLPLISGSNPPGNLGRMIEAIKKGYYFRIGNGTARKSIVSASDIGYFISNLNNKNGIYNLTDGIHPSFKEIEDYIGEGLGKRIITIPKVIFEISAKIGDNLPFFIINTNKLNKIVKSLTFSDEKARRELDWNPSPALKAITFNKK